MAACMSVHTIHCTVQDVAPETSMILQEFEPDSKGYTLIIPFNMVTDYTSNNKKKVELTELYPAVAGNLTEAEADAVVRAHILEDTLTYTKLQNATKSGPYEVTSLQGFVWTFDWKKGKGEVGGYLILKDTWNLTKTGEFNLMPELSIEPDWYELMLYPAVMRW
jgi:hypothetical protein